MQYQRQYQLSQIYLDLLGINFFPLDLENVIRTINRITKYNIMVASESEYLEFRKATNETRDYININDGRSYKYDDNAYFIVYNDSKPHKRIRFTIAHELGHILLGHLEDSITEIDRGGISAELYEELENQADVFAGNFLAPPILINERLKMINSRHTPFIIGETFKISEPAVYNRYKDLDIWIRRKSVNSTEQNILSRCKNSVCLVECISCGAEISITDPESFKRQILFCKYCGGRRFSYIRSDKNMIYDGIEMDENNKAVVCPVCKNEHIIEDGDFCEICGTKLINECIQGYSEDGNFTYSCDKGGRLDGFARFCPYCGSQTSFFEKGILKSVVNDDSKELVTPKGLPF